MGYPFLHKYPGNVCKGCMTHKKALRTCLENNAKNGERCKEQPRSQFRLRLLFVLATEQTLSRMFLNIWRHILFPGDLHDAAL